MSPETSSALIRLSSWTGGAETSFWVVTLVASIFWVVVLRMVLAMVLRGCQVGAGLMLADGAGSVDEAAAGAKAPELFCAGTGPAEAVPLLQGALPSGLSEGSPEALAVVPFCASASDVAHGGFAA